ncbi:MAG: mechanosensitive ion channel family protein, partial [Methylobacteriaceae bacterium]|nr:mechanosensitive ion channel family protein [Methylobacteriaceae bacterium]
MTFTRELLILLATAIAWFAYAVSVNDPSGFNPLLIDIVRNAAWVLSGIVVVQLTALALLDGVVERVWGIPTTALMRFLVHLVLGVTVAALILRYADDFDIAALLTTSALITAILGLAAQSTMAGLFSGIALQLERYIHPGDVIRVEGRPTRVEVVGWRSIIVRRMDGVAVVVPNTVIAGNPMPMFRPGALLRSEAMIAAPISVPPGVVADIIRHAVLGITEISTEQPINVDFHATRPQDGLNDYRIRCFGRSTLIDDDALAPIIRLRVWYAYQRHGIVEPRWAMHPAWAGVVPPTHLAHLDPDVPVASMVSALASTCRWHDAPAAELERLTRRGRRLLYTSHEPILLPRDLDRAVAIVSSGEVRLSGATTSVPDWIEPAFQKVHDRAGADWDAETLQQVESHLGHTIGPYARLAVRQAARDAIDLPALYRQVATLIDDSMERDQFLPRAPSDTAQYCGTGTAFSVRCEGRGLAAPGGPLTARGEVELLAISHDAFSDVQREELRSAP